jgi:hypothetical protein
LFAKLEHSSKEIDELKQRLVSTPDNEIELKAALESAKLENHIMEKLYEQTTDSIIDRSRELEDINLGLKNDQDDLWLKVWDLEEENTWYLECIANYARTHSVDLFPDFTVGGAIDLSALSIVIVGGHTSTRKEVIKVLSAAYSIKDFVEIPPTSEESADEKSVRQTIGNCDLIAVVTNYIGHDLTGIISGLNKKGALKGKVVYLKNRGKSGIVREISSCLLDSYLNN